MDCTIHDWLNRRKMDCCQIMMYCIEWVIANVNRKMTDDTPIVAAVSVAAVDVDAAVDADAVHIVVETLVGKQ